MEALLTRTLIFALATLRLLAFNNIPSLTNNHSTTQAVEDLEIDWNKDPGQPIFTISNFSPGDTEEKSVVIKNIASTLRPISISGIKVEESGNLASVLDFIIMKDDTPIYGQNSTTGPKNLEEFFSQSQNPNGMYLFDLNPNETVTIKFKVTFNTSASNEYQNKKLVFDLKIGLIFKVPQECAGIKFAGSPIYGTHGRDNIQGTNNNDLIFTFEGRDRVFGRDGNDCIISGAGNDQINGGKGNDILLGGPDNDFINGGKGNDTCQGERKINCEF